MAEVLEIAPTDARELVLARLIDAPVAAVWRCWTEPELMKRWFTPRPWKTVEVNGEVRAGGGTLLVMESPEGQRFPNPGQYLEVVPERRLVFTDAYLGDWKPSEKPFMTAVLSFEPAGNKTRYVARVRHFTKADRDDHEARGFQGGWGMATEQLEEVARSL